MPKINKFHYLMLLLIFIVLFVLLGGTASAHIGYSNLSYSPICGAFKSSYHFTDVKIYSINEGQVYHPGDSIRFYGYVQINDPNNIDWIGSDITGAQFGFYLNYDEPLTIGDCAVPSFQNSFKHSHTFQSFNVGPVHPMDGSHKVYFDRTFTIPNSNNNDASIFDLAVIYPEFAVNNLNYGCCNIGNVAEQIKIIPNVVNGQCAIGHYYCLKGNSINHNYNSSTGTYTWQCKGTNGGTTASCSQTVAINGQCASTHYNCTRGNSINQGQNSYYWYWRCSGLNGGATSGTCYQYKSVNGQCASKHNNCSSGTSQDVPDTSTQWKWQCVGANGGITAPCSEYKPILSFTANPNPVNYNTASNLHWTTNHVQSCWASGAWSGWKNNTGGTQSTGNLTSSQIYYLQCWNSQGNSTGIKTVTVNVNAVNGECNNEDAKTYDCHATDFSDKTFCDKGNPNPTNPTFPDKGGSVTWQCQGINGGSNSSCTASVENEVSGKCGSADGQSFYTKPTSNLCDKGTYSTLSYDSNTSQWTWTCSGSCITSVNCSATKKEQKTENWIEVTP